MVLKTQVKSLSVFHLLFVIKIACQLYVYLIKTLPTHLNCGAVARHTGTLVVKGNDVYCIHFPAVKVSPCARSGVCGALMSVAILPHCYVNPLNVRVQLLTAVCPPVIMVAATAETETSLHTALCAATVMLYICPHPMLYNAQ
uniref:Uncharacterized protein n=1 Tax=Oryzias melastigma TaxID=30732 RepID=A0A3B3DDE6_ORYME